MSQRAIQCCDECGGIGCIHCDYQGCWEGDWRCDTCGSLLPAQEAFCVSCEEMATGHAGKQASASEWIKDGRLRSLHLGRTLVRHNAIIVRLWGRREGRAA